MKNANTTLKLTTKKQNDMEYMNSKYVNPLKLSTHDTTQNKIMLIDTKHPHYGLQTELKLISSLNTYIEMDLGVKYTSEGFDRHELLSAMNIDSTSEIIPELIAVNAHLQYHTINTIVEYEK
ncbi:MAG: hypothetical protein ACRC42_00390 [Mycoplasma sp.]